jgi:protoporphyrinogen oxidase
MKTKIAIIGAGPAGLSLANALLRRGKSDFLVLEREAEAGGLCRSAIVDGSPLDIGGGHFLDVRRPAVTEFLFGFMPECEWDKYERDSRISIHGQMIGSPFEANIWQLDEAHQERYLKDIAAAGCNRGEPCPVQFVDWIYWKLGKGIAEDYMLPYNRKMFGDDLNQLGTYWLEKLPNVSYEDTLRSCIEHRPYAVQPGHATFFYPKRHGYGEVWRRMGEALGDRLVCSCPVRTIDVARRRINEDVSADIVVNTSPWTAFEKVEGLSDASLDAISSLKHTSVDVDYVPDNLETKAQWVYLPDENLSEHRWLMRHNFCPGSKGYWKETRKERNAPKEDGAFRHTSEYAYPLNTIGKDEAVAGLLDELSTKRIYGLGRWGEWQHYNSDVVVVRALDMAERILKS